MVTDSIDNCSLYYNLHKHFPAAFQFILKTDPVNLPSDRHYIVGEDVYIMFSEFNGKPEAEAKLETHQKYIDIHFLIDGKERIGYSPKSRCNEINSIYDEEKDFELYNDAAENFISLKKNDFAIFYPGDAHAPGISEGTIIKAVVKIKIE